MRDLIGVLQNKPQKLSFTHDSQYVTRSPDLNQKIRAFTTQLV